MKSVKTSFASGICRMTTVSNGVHDCVVLSVSVNQWGPGENEHGVITGIN